MNIKEAEARTGISKRNIHFGWIALVMGLVGVFLVSRNGGWEFLTTLDGVMLCIAVPLVVGLALYRFMLFYYNN